ncbi:copper transporter [Nocardiopsis algeriensis]|uniref:Copper transport outer membrane protein MctB n=1 Tax=Nocardiopsis algeriensis TaxID=1478215 RepID=A0A841IR90_9ACTN|nr:hypothetical protein [Nocardiopsis algeriensis]
MIDFRYHLVSIIAVFLALTVGIVLGTTMLQDPLLDTLRSETAELRGQTEDLRVERDTADRVNAGADQMAEALSADMLEGRLAGLEVVLVLSPGADAETADSLTSRVEQAGGSVAGRVEIAEELLDDDNTDFAGETARQVLADPDSLAGLDPYEKVGAAVGRALAAPEEDTGGAGIDEVDTDEAEEAEGEPDGFDAEAALAAFADGGLLTVDGSPAASADAAVVLAPAAGYSPSGDDRKAANTALAALVSSLHGELGGLVLAGDVPSARGDGLLALARAGEPGFATADLSGRPMGDVVAVLALAEDMDGAGGAYGIGDGVGGFLPDPLPGPREEPGGDDEDDGAAVKASDGPRDAARGEE